MKYILLCVILLLSCDKGSKDASRRNNPSAVIEIGQADKEIERIAENARRSLPIFLRNLARPGPGAGNFCVKYPLTSYDGRTEHIWLGGIRIKDGVCYGSVVNSTRFNDSIKKGDTIIFEMDSITDWMYVQDGKIVGGSSIKYLLEKTPEAQRSEEQRKILGMFD